MSYYAKARADYKVAYKCVECGALNTDIATAEAEYEDEVTRAVAKDRALSKVLSVARHQAHFINENSINSVRSPYPTCGNCQCAKCGHIQPWGDTYIQRRTDFDIHSRPSDVVKAMLTVTGVALFLVPGFYLAANEGSYSTAFVLGAVVLVLSVILSVVSNRMTDKEDAAICRIKQDALGEINAIVAAGKQSCLPLATTGDADSLISDPDDDRARALLGFRTSARVVKTRCNEYNDD